MNKLIIKIIGVPGGGKTTYILNTMTKLITDKKIHPSNICYITFTKSAASDAKSRIMKLMPCFFNDDFIYFRTMHSLAFRSIGLSKDAVLKKNDYKIICDKVGIEYELDDNINNPENDIVDFIMALQRKQDKNSTTYINIINYVRNKNPNRTIDKDLLKLYFDSFAIYNVNISWEEFICFYEELERYKFENGKVDFTDMLSIFLNNDSYIRMPIKYLFVDECQDMSPLMWQVVKKIIGVNDLEAIYLAGDPNQSIYSFNAADPEAFIKFPDDKVIHINVSNRLSKTIINKVNNFCYKYGMMGNIVPREDAVVGEYIKTPSRGTEYDYMKAIDTILSKGRQESIFILSRTVFQSNKIAQYLYKNNYEFKNYRGKDYISVKKIYDSIDRVKKDIQSDGVRKDDLVKVLKEIKNADYKKYFLHGTKKRVEKSDKEVFKREDLRVIGFKDNFFNNDLVEMVLTSDDYNYCKNMIPADISIGTIHWSKGLEADHVILSNYVPPMIMNNIINDFGQSLVNDGAYEKYVFYTGMTRARKTLYILDSIGGNKFII